MGLGHNGPTPSLQDLGKKEKLEKRQACKYIHRRTHTPSITFRHPPPNSARFSYATEGAFFISAQLSTDAVSALRKVWVLIKL